MTPDLLSQRSSTSAFARACLSPAAVSWAYMRMLVSTKYLSLMELVARLGRRPLQVETLAQPGERAAARLVESLPFPHDRFQTVSQKGTDRPSLLGGQHAGLAEQVSVEFERHVGFHGCCVARCSRAALFYVLRRLACKASDCG